MISVGDVIKTFSQEYQYKIYKILFEENKDLLTEMIFSTGIDNNIILNFCIEKIFFNDETMKNFFKDVLRRNEQKQGLLDLINTFPKDKKMIGVELGSFCGSSTELFLNSGNFQKIYCIDIYEGMPGFVTQHFFDIRFNNVSEIEKIKQRTEIAVNLFEDQSLDFIYIDASHDYESVKKDIQLYFPKVKKGGIIAGHDYSDYWQSVRRAVDESFSDYNIQFFKDSSWKLIK